MKNKKTFATALATIAVATTAASCAQKAAPNVTEPTTADTTTPKIYTATSPATTASETITTTAKEYITFTDNIDEDELIQFENTVTSKNTKPVVTTSTSTTTITVEPVVSDITTTSRINFDSKGSATVTKPNSKGSEKPLNKGISVEVAKPAASNASINTVSTKTPEPVKSDNNDSYVKTELSKTDTTAIDDFEEQIKEANRKETNIDIPIIYTPNNISIQSSATYRKATVDADKTLEIYVVKTGDTICGISDKYGISYIDVLRFNEMNETDIIYEGDEIAIPKTSSTSTSESITSETSESNSETNVNEVIESVPVTDTSDVPTNTDDSSTTAEDSNGSSESESQRNEIESVPYVIQENDGFNSIAEKFNIDFEDAKYIAQYNNMNLDSILFTGEEIQIPNAATIRNMHSVAHAGDRMPENEDNSSVEPSNNDSSINNDDSLLSDDIFHFYNEETVTNEESYDEVSPETNATISESSNEVLETIHALEKQYSGIDIAMGIYKLDGTPIFEYQPDYYVSGACTVKAAYANFVLETCANQGIDIYSETLTYKSYMKNNGSGTIKYDDFDSSYTIYYLLSQLTTISDNTAYNILVSKFSLASYQDWLNQIGGQQLYGVQYGSCTVHQRMNEWLHIYQYANSGNTYSYELRQILTNTPYCYLVGGMANWHNYMHKSGWCDDTDSAYVSYTSASDCSIIDDQYLVIVLTQDYSTGVAHTDAVSSLGYAAEQYMMS